MLPRIRIDRPLHATLLAAPLLFAVFVPPGLDAQWSDPFRDARHPQAGEFWLQLTPSLENWSEQFGLDSPDLSVPDGAREELFRDFDGPVAGRLFPGPEPLIEDLNADAAALGFDPVDPGDFSLGNLQFGTMNAQVRRIEGGLEFGVLRRLSVAVRAQLTYTEMEPSFRYDSLASTVLTGSSFLPAPGPFFSDFDASLDALQGLIDGGTLTPEEQATAQALLESSSAFRSALDRRVSETAILPTGGSAEGAQIATHYADMATGYESFGLSLPELDPPDSAGMADLRAFFENPPVGGSRPSKTSNQWRVGEVEFGARYKLLDQFGRRATPYEGRRDEAGREEEMEEPADAEEPDGDPRSLRLRTSVGATVRIPIRPANVPPFNDATDFVDVPIGDGQPDVELALYQDAAFRSWLWVSLAGRYGIQLSDRLTRRVFSPDKPYALASTESTVRRDLGDYLELRVSPQLRVTDTVALGVVYGFWHKGSDRYTLEATAGELTDAAVLEIETDETRHRLGFGVFYRLAEGADREQPRPPWLLGFVYQTAIAGSGGQTPAAQLVTMTLRVPMHIF